MKTRSNMPLFVLECTDITKLTDGQIDLLRCGDYLVKKTGKQNHAYKVTYKEDKKGICLTYHDASTVETVSYDYTDGHWVYNSTDKALLPMKDGSVYIFDGDLDVDGKITGDEIVENMSGYSYQAQTHEDFTLSPVYSGVCKNGNKVTFVIALNATRNTAGEQNDIYVGKFTIPSDVGAKLFPTTVGGNNFLALGNNEIFNTIGNSVSAKWWCGKNSNTEIRFSFRSSNMVLTSTYYIRIECTFLLSDNLAS